MTHRERILAAIRGDVPDRLPWVPRLDFWYRAHQYQHSMPADFKDFSLLELADRLGVGTYAVVPDFTDCPTGTEMQDRALGIYQAPVIPYRVTLEGVERRVLKRGRESVVEYHTPVGSIQTTAAFTEEMLQSGGSISYVTGYPIRQPRDFAVVGYIFSHLKVEPRYEGYIAHRDRVGERGLVISYASPAASPMHHIMKEFMPVDQFFYATYDYPQELARLAEKMEPYYERIKEISAAAPAEAVMLGANYDEAITYPKFFAQHILPALRDYARVLHRQGKYLMTHTDGENRKLLNLYLEAGFDVADSVCPYPMTSCRLEEMREAFRGRIAIWGGIPSLLLCPSSSSAEECDRFVDDVLARNRGQSRLILGVSDMVTADADWSRLQSITEKVARTEWRAL